MLYSSLFKPAIGAESGLAGIAAKKLGPQRGWWLEARWMPPEDKRQKIRKRKYLDVA